MSSSKDSTIARLLTMGNKTWVGDQHVAGATSTSIIRTGIKVDDFEIAVTAIGHVIAFESHEADGETIVTTLGRGAIDRSAMRFTFKPGVLTAMNGLPVVMPSAGESILRVGGVGHIVSVSPWLIAGHALAGEGCTMSLGEKDGQLWLTPSAKTRGRSQITLTRLPLKGITDVYHFGLVEVRDASFIIELVSQGGETYTIGRIVKADDEGDFNDIGLKEFLKLTGFATEKLKADSAGLAMSSRRGAKRAA